MGGKVGFNVTTSYNGIVEIVWMA